MNMSLIIIERNYGTIDADDYSCHGYYITNFSSTPYNLKSDFSIYGQVISLSEILLEGTYFLPTNINYNHYFYKKTNPITQFCYRGNNQCQCQRNML